MVILFLFLALVATAVDDMFFSFAVDITPTQRYNTKQANHRYKSSHVYVIAQKHPLLSSCSSLPYTLCLSLVSQRHTYRLRVCPMNLIFRTSEGQSTLFQTQLQ